MGYPAAERQSVGSVAKTMVRKWRHARSLLNCALVAGMAEALVSRDCYALFDNLSCFAGVSEGATEAGVRWRNPPAERRISFRAILRVHAGRPTRSEHCADELPQRSGLSCRHLRNFKTADSRPGSLSGRFP